MVTFDEELAQSLADAKGEQKYSESVESVAEWYAILICQGYASENEDVMQLVEEIEKHWADFKESDDPHRMATEKHRSRNS